MATTLELFIDVDLEAEANQLTGWSPATKYEVARLLDQFYDPVLRVDDDEESKARHIMYTIDLLERHFRFRGK